MELSETTFTKAPGSDQHCRLSIASVAAALALGTLDSFLFVEHFLLASGPHPPVTEINRPLRALASA